MLQGERVKEELRMAMAWGFPDNESIGYSQSKMTEVLHKALRYIEFLEENCTIPKVEQIIDI